MEETRWDRFMGFMTRWYGIPATAFLIVLNIVFICLMSWVFNPDSKLAFWLCVGFFIASLLLSYAAFYYHGKRQYGVGMGAPEGSESSDTYATTEPSKPKPAKFQPDSASDDRIRKIGKKYNKLSPPEEE